MNVIKELKVFKPQREILKPFKAHECISCDIKIKKGENCYKSVFSYNNHLLTFYKCRRCVSQPVFHPTT